MIQIFNQIDQLNTCLNSEKRNLLVKDYRIVLSIYNQIFVYLRGANPETIDRFKKNFPSAKCVQAEDEEYDSYFEIKRKVNVEDSRIRLSNLLDNSGARIKNDIPVITFYSYKGGVGRSTTMASFASFLSIHKGMKVVLMDCDFEAPGLSNFFMEDPSNVSYKNGLIEYFLDSEYCEEPLLLKNYYREVSKKYSGDGFIYVFPAGNLAIDETRGYLYQDDMTHYLNGMTRLDMFSKEFMCDKFKQLFAAIKEKLAPDVILLDSRTGFSDVYGITAFRLSDIVVGFFGSDVQSRPGIEFFLNILSRPTSPKLLMAHAIIPLGQKMKLHKYFSEYVTGRLNEISDRISHFAKKELSPLDIEPYPIADNEILRNVGKPMDSYEEYINMIKTQEFPDYKRLFEKIFDLYNDVKGVSPIKGNQLEARKSDLQKMILNNTLNNLPSLYGQEVKDFDTELNRGRYFFRRCMQDLFNSEKFLVRGEKGTGKSYIYQSLANSSIVEILKIQANKSSEDYIFVPIIETNNIFSTEKLNYNKELNSDLYFERFWIVYIWNEVMRHSPFGYKTKLSTFEISNQSSTDTARQFKSRILSDDSLSEIERDLKELDLYIESKVKNGHVVFIFDELDRLVKPLDWSERIAPLINLCRNMSYGHIDPKLFVRKDLFERMANINNKNDLINKTIEIEWSREELFAFFFKQVLSHSKKEFFELMDLYGYYPHDEVLKSQQLIEASGDQPPLDEFVLKNLVAVFFGKYADVKNSMRYGLSYDWFFTNLKNANDTISLRPFIDLLKGSLDMAVKRLNSQKKNNMPILSPEFYTTSTVRSAAVKRHIDDLSSEDGNRDLKVVIDFLRDKAPVYLKKDFLPLEKFYELLDLILEKENLQENKDRDSLTNMLVVDGVVRQKFKKGIGAIVTNGYQFALLYKYYLGLKTRNFSEFPNKNISKTVSKY